MKRQAHKVKVGEYVKWRSPGSDPVIVRQINDAGEGDLGNILEFEVYDPKAYKRYRVTIFETDYVY